MKLKKCKCGCSEPIIYNEMLIRKAVYPVGINDFYSKEYYGYIVRCNECYEETEEYTTIEKAVEAWNEGKIL